MLDPSWDVYVMDEADCILDAPTLRRKLAEGTPLRPNDESRMSEKSYLNYLAKDMYYFTRAEDVHYGVIPDSALRIHLCPDGYEVEDGKVVYATYDSFWA
jgi:hypothetical protein